MRLWSLHPRHLDAVGLASVWRKALLARQVLRGRAKAHRKHPQVERFRSHPSPLSALSAYLQAVYAEASARGYAVDRRRLGTVRGRRRIPVTADQLACEWEHLGRKLAERCPERARRLGRPTTHSLFHIVPCAVEAWEHRRRP